MELERRRLTAIQQAEKDGNWIRKMRLQAAGIPHIGDSICFLCDPIRTEPAPSNANENIENEQDESDAMGSDDTCDRDEQNSGTLTSATDQERELEVVTVNGSS